MPATRQDLKARTKLFALGVIRLSRTLPNKPEAWVISRQVLRSATSVAANYRAACRARSHAEFTAKLGIVLEEADETAFWLELLADAGIIEKSKLAALSAEADELVAMFVASCRSSRKNEGES